MAFSITDIFKGFGKSGDTSVLGIDVGASSIKIVQLRASRGIAVLETYGEIALSPYAAQSIGKAVKLPPEKIAEALIDVMKEANVTSHSGGMSIPFSASLVTILDLPRTDAESLKRVVPIEARKYIPIPVTEVMLDWYAIPEEKGEDSAFAQIHEQTVMQKQGQEVLLVAIHNDTLQQYQTIVSTAGIHIQFYEIEIFSAIRSSMGHGITPSVVVDLGASSTKIYIVERGIVRLTHLVPIGGMHLTETMARSLDWDFDKAERVKRERGLINSSAYSIEENDRIHTALLSTLNRVFSEVNRVVLSYGERYNKNVPRVVLMGGGAALPGVEILAKQLLNIEVSLASPFSHTEAPAFLENVLRSIGPAFAVAVGLALRKLRHE